MRKSRLKEQNASSLSPDNSSRRSKATPVALQATTPQFPGSPGSRSPQHRPPSSSTKSVVINRAETQGPPILEEEQEALPQSSSLKRESSLFKESPVHSQKAMPAAATNAAALSPVKASETSSSKPSRPEPVFLRA